MKKIISIKIVHTFIILIFISGFFSSLWYFHYRHTPKKAHPIREISSVTDIYTEKIAPILNNRCIACHSCLESPCQLNLQSFGGLQRGANKKFNVYDGARLKDENPTRMYEDAQTTEQWRDKGFFDIIGNDDFSIFNHLITNGAYPNRTVPKMIVEDSRMCVETKFELENRSPENQEDEFNRLSMPYGFPGLTPEQRGWINQWLAQGAPGPLKESTSDFKTISQLNLIGKTLPLTIAQQIKDWESFLNNNNLKNKITARYLYEHLFLAHLYFKENLTNKLDNSNQKYIDLKNYDLSKDANDPRLFFKLIRSSIPCNLGPKIIASRKPNDDPGVQQWYYCFVSEKNTIVDKTHIPYELSTEKLKWVKKIFIDKKWRATQFPSFSPETSGNPFITFREMPIISRYEFLLNDAQYHVMTFIKGPVCNGTKAVNSIQDQFYAVFINPRSELMAINRKFAHIVESDLILPGIYGTEVSPSKLFSLNKELVQKRNEFRKTKQDFLKLHRPEGLSLNDLWDGNGNNPNALLTIIRHDQSARVLKGAFGDISKTVFVIDYSLLERLVYNLVVNFDVFGNVGHQYLTRAYMDLIRMEAENNFLDFLPPADRSVLKSEWYKGAFTKLKLELYNENEFSPIGTMIKYQNVVSVNSEETKNSESVLEKNINSYIKKLGSQNEDIENANEHKKQLLQQIIFNYLNETVRGPADNMNWKKLKPTNVSDNIEEQLKKASSINQEFTKYFPDFSILFISKQTQIQKSYSIIHNKEHSSISWILGESLRLSPDEDTLTIAKGYHGSYPNLFFSVEENQIEEFVHDILQISSDSKYNKFVKKYGVHRMNPNFWYYYDFIIKDFLQQDPINASYMDLSRYDLGLNN